jgi:hypothetical protein
MTTQPPDADRPTEPGPQPGPLPLPPMNPVWSQEDPRHPAASTRNRWRYDPYWWLWPTAGACVGVFLGVIAYGLAKLDAEVARGLGALPTQAHTAAAVYLVCAAAAIAVGFLLPHRWVWLWARIPLSLFAVAMSILFGAALAPS